MADVSLRMGDVMRGLTLRIVVTRSGSLMLRMALGMRLIALGARLTGCQVDIALADAPDDFLAVDASFRPLGGVPATTRGFRRTRDGCSCCGLRPAR